MIENTTAPERIKGIFLGRSLDNIARVWRPRQRQLLEEQVEFPPCPITPEEIEAHAPWLAETQVIFSTWGMPQLSAQQLDLMPKLKAVFYAAGSVKGFAAPLFDREIMVVSAWAANAVPVAEFTLSQILFSLKLGWQHLRQIPSHPDPARWNRLPVKGVYGASVGIIALGMIGRKLCEFLRPFHVHKLIYDPLVTHEGAAALGGQKTGLKELFAQSDVVTLHAPWLPETEGLITGELIASMKPYATLINTARGALIREPEMIAVLKERPDLTAVLDVTLPEPPLPGSPLYHLDNVILTPHIAGSLGDEVERMSDLMISEFMAWRQGRALHYVVSSESSAKIS